MVAVWSRLGMVGQDKDGVLMMIRDWTLVLVLLAVGAAGLAFGQAVQEPVEQEVAAFAGPPHRTGAWEYEVVGLTDIYGSTLDYLKDAVSSDNESSLSGLLGLGKKVDDQLVAKTRDLLNEYGAKGWELVEYRGNVFVFKRPKK
ncbi:MAG: hypothetical protein ACI8QC_004060 [Planctomycetota bacterium]|jgi:hypothetical protein